MRFPRIVIACLLVILLIGCQSNDEPTEQLSDAMIAPIATATSAPDPTATTVATATAPPAESAEAADAPVSDALATDTPVPDESEQPAPAEPEYVGCPDVTYPDWETSPYVLPFPPGETYRVDLSNCSRSYHGLGQPDELAIDFRMPIGTLITASRGGVVLGVVEEGVDYRQPNNMVVVEHEDGTVLAYMHLTENGAIPETGDVIEQGDPIGYSGATGLAGYPHLHLVLLPNAEPYPYESLPITFSNTAPNPFSLATDTDYTAFDY